MQIINANHSYLVIKVTRTSQVALVVKIPPANAGNKRDVGLITGSGRLPGRGTATHSSILAWKILWTEEAGRLLSVGCKEADTIEAT